MDSIPSNLCTLIEQLEDARQFHDGAARQSAGLRSERHCQQSLAYTAMLAEIRDWESRKRQSGSALDFGAAGDGPGLTHLDDSYASLLERVYRIHRSAVPVRQSIRSRATGETKDGSAREGPRRAGVRARG